ncbi:MAG TPA: SPASM domain-containing protein, partial [Candidatus Kapabacteria bacterium]|nr:SPASM domain-containing protein [Candidatus Kapabacteria bacterium]
KNFRQLREVVDLGLALGLQRVSFLSVDVLSDAFGREHGVATAAESELLLSGNEVHEFRDSINKLAETHADQFASGFISESVPKLVHLADYFKAALKGKDFPHVNCNAPMVSTVITSTGNVLPCFFLPPLGNIRKQSLRDILNGKEAKQTRRDVRDYTYDRCHTCVCSLRVSPLAFLRKTW